MRIQRIIQIAAVFGALSISAAEAHTGAGSTAGFGHGFVHPFSGLDHILAMVAVGLVAAHLGERALWLVPCSFIVMMAAGGVLGASGVELPLVEVGIAMSVIVLGGLVAFQASLPTGVAMGLVGFFAIFHGHAHGAEMPVDASGVSYAGGFIVATAILHAVGVAIGLRWGGLSSGASRRVAQFGGGAMALAGVGILSGYL